MSQYRLGFPVKVLGAPLRSHDSRRWQNRPHLSVSLAYVRDILAYLHQKDIHFYRLAGQLAPYATHPALPQFHNQIEACATELAETGDLARAYGIRLSMHPAHYVQLSSPDEERAARSRYELKFAARLLDAMGLGLEAILVVHVGGSYGDGPASRERFVRSVLTLPNGVLQRLALEHDDRLFSFQDALWIHRRTGVRLILDTLHHRCLADDDMPVADALQMAIDTWPGDQRPKIHFSSPRTALRRLYRQGRPYYQTPLANQHSDFIHPFEFIDFLRAARRRSLRAFDIMLEAKAKDLALLQLRKQVARFAPDLLAQLG